MFISRRSQWVAFGLGMAALGLVIIVGPKFRVSIDHLVFDGAVQRMQAGDGYYRAMDASLREVVGPASTPRAFREPLAFWVWASADAYRWGFALVMIAASAWIMARIATPTWGLTFGGWFLMSTFMLDRQLWGFVHVWSVPFLLLAVWAALDDRWHLAAALALLSACIVEQAALMFVGGVLAASASGVSWRPWAVAAGGWALWYGIHATATLPYLVEGGTQAKLFGTGDLLSVIMMAGPHTGLGILIVVTALVTRRFHPVWWLCAPLLVVIPISGFFMSRVYWGYLVLPVAIALLGAPVTVHAERQRGRLPLASGPRTQPLTS